MKPAGNPQLTAFRLEPAHWLPRPARLFLQYTGWPGTLILSMCGVYFACAQGLPPALAILSVGTIAFGICTLLQTLIPMRGDWRAPAGSERLDLLHLPLTELTAQSTFRSIVLGAGFLAGAELTLLQSEGPWRALGLDHLPVPIQLLLSITILDLGLYWQHRMMHEIPALWDAHRIHHSPRAMTVMSAFRNHPIGPFITATILMAFGLLAMPQEVFVMSQAWIAVKGWLQHANADLKTPLFDPFFQTPQVHRWHHSTRREESDSNFGILVTLWDRVPWHRAPVIGPRLHFQRSTFFLPKDRETPERVGLEEALFDPAKGPLGNWWSQFSSPFKAWGLDEPRRWVSALGWPVAVSAAVIAAATLYRSGLPAGQVGGLLAVSAIGLAALFQAIAPLRDDWRGDRRSIALDLAHAGLSEGIPHALATLALGLLGVWLGGALGDLAQIDLWASAGIGGWPLAAQFALGLLLLDLGLYWQHRLMHEIPAFWQTHRIHHAIRTLSPTRAARHHPLSPLLTTVVWALFGLTGAPELIFVMCQGFAATNGALQHANADLRIGKLDRIFASPAFHRQHHSRELRESASNFGPNLSVWDQVPWHRLPVIGPRLAFQYITWSPSPDHGPPQIGLDEPLEDSTRPVMVDWWRQVYEPIRSWFTPQDRGGGPGDGPGAAADLLERDGPALRDPVSVSARASGWRRLAQLGAWPAAVVGAVASAWAWTRSGLPSFPVMVLVSAAAIGLSLWLEKVLPFKAEWRTSRRDLGVDVAHMALSAGGGSALFSIGLLAAGAMAGGALSAANAGTGAWTQLGLDRLPALAQFAIALPLLDLGMYWHHRLMHEIPALWRIHSIHHAPSTLTASRAVRNHPIGPVITAAILAGHGALGMAPEIAAMCQAFICAVGLLQHTNADLRLGPLDAIFCGPRMHRWHHSYLPEEADNNFSNTLTLWDRTPWHWTPLRPLLRFKRRTLLLPDDREIPARIGLEPAPLCGEGILSIWWGHVLEPFGHRSETPVDDALPAK